MQLVCKCSVEIKKRYHQSLHILFTQGAYCDNSLYAHLFTMKLLHKTPVFKALCKFYSDLSGVPANDTEMTLVHRFTPNPSSALIFKSTCTSPAPRRRLWIKRRLSIPFHWQVDTVVSFFFGYSSDCWPIHSFATPSGLFPFIIHRLILVMLFAEEYFALQKACSTSSWSVWLFW